MSAIPSSNHVPPALPTRARPKCPFPNPPLPTLPIVSADVPRQFARRGDLSEAQFLYGEVARRMLGRLQYIRLAPQAMLDAGCGAGDNLPLLRERYPDAAYTGLDNCEPLLAAARKRHAPGGLGAWIGSWRAVARPRPPSSMATWRRPAWRRNRWSWSGPTWPCTGTARRTRRWPNGGAC